MQSDSSGCVMLLVFAAVGWWHWHGRGCSEYASEYSCRHVVDNAEYEVWYWRHVERDDSDDEKYIGRAIGLRMCENNARAYAASIDETFEYRSYICVLVDDGQRMEKHRFLG